MSPRKFITKWSESTLGERQAAQSHFLDLCRLLEVDSPAEADTSGDTYAFEKGAQKTTGRSGYADVWKQGAFAWEYKGPGRDLDAAYAQLQQYAPALGNPPLLVVSDTRRIVVRTNWTNTVSEVHSFELADIAVPEVLQKLRWLFVDPERFRPTVTREAVTQDVAGSFAELADELRRAEHEPLLVAHFINQLVFCMFAEDAKLLKDKMFTRVLETALSGSVSFQELASDLFSKMHAGGRLGLEKVPHFNGGLFADGQAMALPLSDDQVRRCLTAARLDWSQIDPSILGTLFVRGLDPSKREELGAEYTSRETIMTIVRPVLTDPVLAEWTNVRSQIEALIDPAAKALSAELDSAGQYPELAEEIREVQSNLTGGPQLILFDELPKLRKHRQLDQVRRGLRGADRAYRQALEEGERLYKAFLARLRAMRVLDPACGSGNFLYLALDELKTLEWRIMVEGEALGFERAFPSIGPEAVLGIELNPYAAELARVSVWIGEIQWMLRNGFDVNRAPVLKPLEKIENKNALVDDEGSAAIWPDADVIVGNPPYMGAKQMKRRLGVEQTNEIRGLYQGRLPAFTDLVCFWFENARTMIEEGRTRRAGLVATNSIRKNTNLNVMHRIVETSRIFAAWPEQRWDIEGAAVDVSLVCFGEHPDSAAYLDGEPVTEIHADLTAGLNMTLAQPLAENAGVAMLGIQKSGPFDVAGALARKWIAQPANPNGVSNAAVLKPYWNGDDVTGRPRDVWLIDLPSGLTEASAAQFAAPFHHIASTPDEEGKLIVELRNASGSSSTTYPWWEPWRRRPEMRRQIEALSRYIVTPETAQYRVFSWLSYPTLPDKNLIVIARDDDLMFGLLQSRFHELWSLRKGSDLQDRPRYTHTSTFATFPFPDGMTPDTPVETACAVEGANAIVTAAQNLDRLRTSWLWPEGSWREVSEEAPGLPVRRVPIDQAAADLLRARTMTELYNERPEWLQLAHRALDDAVALAYDVPSTISDDDALEMLLEKNLDRG